MPGELDLAAASKSVCSETELRLPTRRSAKTILSRGTRPPLLKLHIAEQRRSHVFFTETRFRIFGHVCPLTKFINSKLGREVRPYVSDSLRKRITIWSLKLRAHRRGVYQYRLGGLASTMSTYTRTLDDCYEG